MPFVLLHGSGLRFRRDARNTIRTKLDNRPSPYENKYLATELITPIATKTCPQKGSFGAAPVDVEPRLFHHEI